MKNILDYSCTERDQTHQYNMVDRYSDSLLETWVKDMSHCVERSIIIFMKEDVPDKVDITEYKCPKNNMVITPIRLVFEDVNHYTIMITDHQKKEAEYFEPNGTTPWLLNVEAYLQKLSNYNFIPTLSYCPSRGPQYVSQKSWCVAFSLLYTYLRIYEPDLNRNEIIKLLTGDRIYINNLIEKFVCLLYNQIYFKYKLYENYEADPRVLKTVILWHLNNIRRTLLPAKANKHLTPLFNTLDNFNIDRIKNIQEATELIEQINADLDYKLARKYSLVTSIIEYNDILKSIQ